MMTALVITWFVLFLVGLALYVASAFLRTVREFDWVHGLACMCILAAMVVGVLMIFA